jgi:serine/threonine protein kinase
LVLNGRYRIMTILGKGGFGAVYKAFDENLQRLCAIKENLETSPDSQRQFIREAQVLANLSHPNLPRVTDYFSLPGQGQYLVMDFIDGEDLEKLVARSGPVPHAQALAWIAQIIDALNYLHSRQPPVLHRDIKPANIRITPHGGSAGQSKAVLVDFGLVKILDPHLRTTVGARAVTPSYSPPEQYGMGSTDSRSDIYALGATLYTLLTGEIPPESIQRVAQDNLLPVSTIAQGVPYPVGQAVAKAMALSPSQRFQSVADFKAGLLSTTAPPAPPVVLPPVAGGPTQKSATPPGKRQLWLILGGIAGVTIILLGVCVGVVWSSGLLPIGNSPTATFTLDLAEDVTIENPAVDTPTSTPTFGLDVETFTPTQTVFSPLTDTPTSTPTSPTPPTFTPTPSLTATIPPPPPTGSDLAFVSDRDGQLKVYLSSSQDTDRFSTLPIPSGYDRAWWPRFCGSRVAVEAYSSTGSNVQWIYFLDPTNFDRFEPGGSYTALGVPSCSPDGRYLAFSGKEGDVWVLAVTDLGGGGTTPVFVPPGGKRALFASWVFSSDIFYFMENQTSKYGIQRAISLGNNAWDLSSFLSPVSSYPAISPDGNTLAYVCDVSNLCVINVSSGQEITRQPLNYVKIEGSSISATAMWSSDGQWIYFASADGGDWDIFRMHPDGSSLQNMTQGWTSNEIMPALRW